MLDIQWPLFLSAFLAGVVTFLAPCTLPLIPAFLGIISGIDISSQSQVQDLRLRRKILINAAAYVVGFSVVFIILGSLFTVAIKILAVKTIIQKVGGVFLLILGLSIGGWIKLGFLSRFQHQSNRLRSAGLFNSFILGSLFSLSWTPCIGPVLGSILLLSSLPSSTGVGILLLAIFCLGLGLPFILVALLFASALKNFRLLTDWAERISKVSGIVIIFFGILMIFGQFETVLGKMISFLFRSQLYEQFIYRFM